MSWDARAELLSLQEQFRRPSDCRNWELLDAEWRTWFPNLEAVAEGDLRLPSPSDPKQFIRGRIFLFDGSTGRPVVWSEQWMRTAAPIQTAAHEFQRLASLCGDIITRIPELVAGEVRQQSGEEPMHLMKELRALVDCGGSAQGKNYEQWWFAYLFREFASPVVPCGLAELIGGVAYNASVKGLFRASETACGRLLAVLTTHCKPSSEKASSWMDLRRERELATDELEQLVRLDQMAAAVNRSKKTLERLKADGKLPQPDVEGGGGKPDEWNWSNVKPILEQRYNRKLPDCFPSLRK